MQNKTRSRSNRDRRTIAAIFTILVTALLVLSVLIIPRAISTYAVSNIGPNPHYVPSSAFGDSDDLPASALKPAARGLAAGSSSVSGTVTDASSGQPVANALVGISAGAVGSTAQYATTASDGSYSFSGIANGTYNLAASRYSISGTQPLYRDAQQM